MDLQVTGKFIKERRKAKGLTQLGLSQKLSVSEKTVSKWECGNGFPDTTLMLPLCSVLGITANELLSAKLLSSEEYKDMAEQNLIELKDKVQKANKHLLTFEWVFGYLMTLGYIVCIFVASFVQMFWVWRALLIAFGFINLIVGVIFSIRIEQVAGFYECGNYKHKYVPTYKSVFFSMHYGRTRYMKCPKCGKKTWQKKTIDDN